MQVVKMNVTNDWVNERIKIYGNGQLFFSGKPITTVHNDEEIERVVGDLCTALNNPVTVGADNPIDAVEKVRLMHNQRRLLKKSPYEYNKHRIDVSGKLYYKTSKFRSGLSFSESFNDIFKEISASQLLDICSDLKNGRPGEYINQQYCNDIEDSFDLVVYAWNCGKLNKAISHICSRSNNPGGYMDHFVGETIRNRIASQYLKEGL